jgi:hypothetical protein
MIALVAEDADGAGFLHQRAEFVEFFFCLRRLQVPGINLVQHLELAAARGLAAVLWRAEPAQMQVGNAALIEPGRKLVLGKTGAAGGGDGAHVDQQFHAGLLEFVEHGLGGRLFIADGEKAFGLADHVGIQCVGWCQPFEATLPATRFPHPRCRSVRHVA